MVIDIWLFSLKAALGLGVLTLCAVAGIVLVNALIDSFKDGL